MKKILVLFLTIFSFSQVIGQDTIGWSAPTTISGTGASDPHVVMDPSGNVTAAWTQGTTIMASLMPVSTGVFGAATQISGSGTASLPRLGVDSSGNVTALWLESGVVYSNTLPASTIPTGGTWSGPTAVSSMGSTASSPSLAVDTAGDAIAVWVTGGLVETSTQVFGGSWSGISIFSSVTNSDSPRVAAGGGKAVIVWHNITGSGADALSSSYATVGGSWSSVLNILPVTPAFNVAYPNVAVDSNGNAIVLFYRYNLSGVAYVNVEVLASELTSTGTTWSVPPTVLSNPGLINPSQLMTRIFFDPNGNAIAIWTNSYDGDTYTVESSNKPTNGNWATSAIQNILGNPYAYQADVSTNSLGNALLVDMSFDGTNLNIQSQEVNFSGISEALFWSFSLTVSTGTDNGYPRCANTIIGGTTLNAAAVWIQSSSGNNTIQASVGSRTLLSPPTTLSVTQSPNDFGVFTSYTNTFSWDPSPSPNIMEYAIYRNGVFITAFDTSIQQYIDYNAVFDGSVTYGVSVIDDSFFVSPTATVSFP